MKQLVRRGTDERQKFVSDSDSDEALAGHTDRCAHRTNTWATDGLYMMQCSHAWLVAAVRPGSWRGKRET